MMAIKAFATQGCRWDESKGSVKFPKSRSKLLEGLVQKLTSTVPEYHTHTEATC